MRVYEVYDKNSKILDHGKNVFKTTEAYLAKFPECYSECCNRNLETLELIKVDRLPDNSNDGVYNQWANKIVFSKNSSLGHELFHVASTDSVNERAAFESYLGIEDGLIEGMTEYHHIMAYDLPEPGVYSFEVFSVMMLEDIPNIFKSYFIPDEKGLFEVISDKKALYGLLWSTNIYNQMTVEYLSQIYASEEGKIDRNRLRMTIRDVIDNLISIELSRGLSKKELNSYGDKFMDLLSSTFVSDIVPYFYPNYVNYADKQIKKRIRGRD